MTDKTMQATSEVVPSEHGGRPVPKPNGIARIALPMTYVEECASTTEKDFLWRFFEAWDFAVNGNLIVLTGTGEPLGRYADHADRVDPETYIRTEVQAYKWVKQYGLGREWATIADIYLQMMADSRKIAMLDWGFHLTKHDNEYIAIGGATVSVKLLGLRLKDAYRDFFRYYRYVQECSLRGEEPTGKGAFDNLERERRTALEMQRFKHAAGLSEPEAIKIET